MPKVTSKIEALRLEKIYNDTERSGTKVNSFDLKVIATRFFFASHYVKRKRIVEFGAGSILGKSAMLSQCKSYTAIEIHPITASELRSAIGGKHVILNEDCCDTSLPNNCCDTIIAFAMIYYTNFNNLIAEATRLLKPNGKIIFCSPNSNQPNFKPAPGSVEYLQPKEIEEICAKYGITIKTFAAYPYKLPKKNTITTLTRFLRARLNIFLGILRKISPQTYLYLRSLRFGKIEQISNDVKIAGGFDVPVIYNPIESQHFRMFYYEGTKSL